MSNNTPVVVIDNGSYTTKAGFSSDDLPSMVFSSNYAVDTEGNKIVGDDEICLNSNGEVIKLLDNGLIYDFESAAENWKYVYRNIDNRNSIEANEFPLMLTEQPWNTSRNKLATTQMAFEEFQVPLFSLVKTPLAHLYHMGKSSGVVIDIGSAVTSVTPILDGIIQTKSSFHSKYAGDFLNLNILEALQVKSRFDSLLPKQFSSSSNSFQNYHISHNILQDFKSSSPKVFQLYDKRHIKTDNFNYLDSLFHPTLHKLSSVSIPEPVVDKPQTHGLINLVFLSLKSLESSMVQGNSQGSNRFARFNEILRTLMSNVIITGGSTLATGLVDRIMNDLRALAPQYFPNYGFNPYYIQGLNNHQPGETHEIWDRQFGAWLGACNLANMINESSETETENIALNNWFISKADYEELGEDLVLEKLK